MCAILLRQVPAGAPFRLVPDSTAIWKIIRKLPDRWGRVKCETANESVYPIQREFHIERTVYINDNLLR